MNDILDLLQPQAPAAPKPKRAPKVAAAPAGGMSEDQFQSYLKGEESPPAIPGKGWGMSPQQEATFRATWPQVDLPDDPGAHQMGGKLIENLDELGKYAPTVFKAPKVDKRAREAVEKYYTYLGKKKKTAAGGGDVLETVKETFIGPENDPIEKMPKGAARDQAVAMRNLVQRLTAAKTVTGETADPFEVLTSMLPSPKDTPADAARKRSDFADQLEHMANRLPPQYWRAAKRHLVRARALRAGGESVPAAKPGAAAPPAAPGAPPVASAEVPAEEEADPTSGWLKRALVTGSTGLALPVIAGLRAMADETPAEHQQGQAMMMPPGMAAAVGAPPVPTLAPEQRGKGFGEHAAELRDTRARALGEADDAALEERMAADRQELPYVARGAQFAGGIMDPANLLLGLPAKAAQSLSPVLRGIVSYTAPGAVAGGLSTAGAGGSPTDILKGTAVGGLAGTVLGKGAEKLLKSPANNPLIKQAVTAERDTVRMTGTQEAARRREFEADVFSNPDATAVATGSKAALHEFPTKLVEMERALFSKHHIAPGDPVHTMFLAIDDAVKAGDLATAQSLRDTWSKLGVSPALKREAEALFNMRELEHVAKGSAKGGHGPVSDAQANRNPIATASSTEAGFGAKAVAAGHLAGEGMGDRAVKSIVISSLMKPIKGVAQKANAALARLYLARQTGDSTAVQAAFEHAIQSGVPYGLASQIATYSTAAGGEE